MSIDVRALTSDDLDAALPLVREAVPALVLDRELLDANLLGDPGALAELALAAFDSGELGGIACATTRICPSPECPASRSLRGHLKVIAVRRQSARRGVGSLLLRLVETRLAALGARTVETDGAAPVYLQPGVPDSATSALAFFAKAGYHLLEARQSMSVDLARVDVDTSALESRLAQEAIILRRAVPADLPRVTGAIAASFSADWAEEVARSIERRAPGTWLAVRASDGELAAFACAGLWARNAFGPMGTRDGFLGRGLGTVLVRRCLADLRAAGARTAVISWVGPERFYRRVAGAETTLRFRALVKTLRRDSGSPDDRAMPAPIPPEALPETAPDSG